MTDARRFRLALPAIFGLILLAGAAPGHAQGLSTGAAKPVVGTAKDENAPEQPPPAIPGAASSPDMVAPASKVAAEMMPNEALFDGINRGDLSAARDALNRGADLNAHNLLGQTPLDSSIDLNRNDITFLLMSMRPSSNTPGGSDNGEASAANTPASRVAAAAAAKTASRPLRITRARAVRTPPPAPVPRQFAGDGGAPNPAVGFVGFGQGK